MERSQAIKGKERYKKIIMCLNEINQNFKKLRILNNSNDSIDIHSF